MPSSFLFCRSLVSPLNLLSLISLWPFYGYSIHHTFNYYFIWRTLFLTFLSCIKDVFISCLTISCKFFTSPTDLVKPPAHNQPFAQPFAESKRLRAWINWGRLCWFYIYS